MLIKEGLHYIESENHDENREIAKAYWNKEIGMWKIMFWSTEGYDWHLTTYYYERLEDLLKDIHYSAQ